MLLGYLLETITVVWLCVEIGAFIEAETEFGKHEFWTLWLYFSVLLLAVVHAIDMLFLFR